ncbi:MAG TPA: hypothetical protein PLB01_19300, partial [Thermoanaerobaculia bacterium]|nr:hypothetical protein [Thermoanaerobaculia bacterium]
LAQASFQLLASRVAERRAGDGPEALAVAGLAETPAPAADAAILSRFAEWSLPVLDPLPEGTLRLGIRVVPP